MPQMFRRSVSIPVLAVLFSLFPAWRGGVFAEERSGLAPSTATWSSVDLPALTAIGVVSEKSGTKVTISGDADLTYEYFVIEGRSLAIDFPGATSRIWPAEQQVNDEFVGRLRVAEQTGEKPGVRVVFDLKKPDGFTVRGDGAKVTVAFENNRQEAGVPARGPAPEASLPATAQPPSQGTLNRVSDVTATKLTNVFRVAVKTDARPSFRVLESTDPTKVTVAIDGARLEPGSLGTRDYAKLDTPVTRISVGTDRKDSSAVLIAVEVRRPVPFRVFTDAHGLNIDFSADVPRPAVAGPSPPVGGPPAKQAFVPFDARSQEPDSAMAAYKGSKITLDFLDADITDIFRLIADVAGLSIVATDDVKGKRSVKMTEVPWDQALDVILRTNIPQLVQIREADNLLRITTLNRMSEERSLAERKELEVIQIRSSQMEQELKKQENERKAAEERKRYEADQRKHLTPRQTRLFSLYNEDTGKIAGELKKYATTLQECEDCVFQPDERTSTIYVRDYPDKIAIFDDIVRVMTEATSAVVIEARIVEVQSDFSQAIGIEWGSSYTADPGHGNATNFAFPNSIGIGGTMPGNYLVNLPATGAVSGVGVSLGHIANTFSLDMKLSAMERLGKTKILSNPKIIAVQGELAKIHVGSSLPIITTDNEGRKTVEFLPVGIDLEVTPWIRSDGRVLLKVLVKKDQQGITVPTTEGDMFSIDGTNASTKVLIRDGETTVIGGLYTQSTTSTDSGVPALSKLPLVGWLFKAKQATNKRQELMIFLTPRIVANQQ